MFPIEVHGTQTNRSIPQCELGELLLWTNSAVPITATPWEKARLHAGSLPLHLTQVMTGAPLAGETRQGSICSAIQEHDLPLASPIPSDHAVEVHTGPDLTAGIIAAIPDQIVSPRFALAADERA